MLGIQYAITHNDQLDVNYIGNRGVRMIGSHNSNQLNPQVPVVGSDLPGRPQSTNPFARAAEDAGIQRDHGGPSSCNLDNAT